ncbi:trace amine-associated receptor 7h-like isoform X2 [Acanthopagrus latus]|uniref:trace amine-associated receptor 7h-like isoform X2 n=1 Tax=Acanthopagrus latus TaxID=8177 RepID=UPI00187CBC22|nr:trace amine-associated receptor 7h-like isoform X2 [Acanthopagrus latus]
MEQESELCFPQLLNASCRRPAAPQPEALLAYILLFIISLLAATLNLLVIISISHFRQLRSPTNHLLLSLAVSDLLVVLLVMPVEVLLTGTCWVLGDLVCALYFFLPVTLISASVGNMVLISVDRVLLLSDHLQQPGRYNSCSGECVVSIAGDVDLVVAFIIPISVIVVLYVRVFVVAVTQARATRSQLSVTVKIRRSELKAARTLGVVVAVFLICYSPYYCLSLTGGNIVIGSSAEAAMSFLMYFNSCLNPLIYALLYPWFRRAIRLIVTLQILQPDSCETSML